MTTTETEAGRRPVTKAEVANYLRGAGFARSPDEPAWWLRHHVRVVQHRSDKIGIYVFHRGTGEGWVATLESPPLRVLAALLETEPPPGTEAAAPSGQESEPAAAVAGSGWSGGVPHPQSAEVLALRARRSPWHGGA